MQSFRVFVDSYGSQIVFVLISLFALMAFVQWACWIAGWGRFRRSVASTDDAEEEGGATHARRRQPAMERPLRFVFMDLFARLVDDFRHLLALVVMLVFFVAVLYALWIGGSDVDNLNKALQAITGSLSGIIGVIIGYYFGETSARASGAQPDVIRPGGPPVQGPPRDADPSVQRVGAADTAPRPAPLPPEGP